MGMSFGDAIALLKLGRKVTREGWNGKDMFLELQVPSDSRLSVKFLSVQLDR